VRSSAAVVLTDPAVRKWTKDEYHEAAELGWFDGQRVELIEGEVVRRYMPTLVEPIIRKWTKHEYHEAAELGWFDGQRVALIDGEVVEMAAQRDDDAMSLTLTVEAAREAFGKGYTYRVQMPLNVSSASEPEPDLIVIRGAPRSVRKHPTTAVLIVEVRRKPTADEEAAFGHSYAETTIYRPGDTISPLGARKAKVRVADLLP
jgi:hypothetical protein